MEGNLVTGCADSDRANNAANKMQHLYVRGEEGEAMGPKSYLTGLITCWGAASTRTSSGQRGTGHHGDILASAGQQAKRKCCKKRDDQTLSLGLQKVIADVQSGDDTPIHVDSTHKRAVKLQWTSGARTLTALLSGQQTDKYVCFFGSRLEALSTLCAKGHVRQSCVCLQPQGSVVNSWHPLPCVNAITLAPRNQPEQDS